MRALDYTPFPQIDIIGAVVNVWRARGKIIMSVLCRHMWTLNRPNSSLDWVLSHWAHFTVRRDSFLCMYYFVSDFTLHACVLCSIVTRWAGPGGIEAWSLGPLLPSVLWHCWLGKPVPDMTCNVFSGTLHPTQSINQSSAGLSRRHVSFLNGRWDATRYDTKHLQCAKKMTDGQLNIPHWTINRKKTKE